MRSKKTRLRHGVRDAARARPGPRRRRLRQQQRQQQLRPKRGEGGGAIVSNPENGKVSLTIGSKNFPEQEILGEIYAQALAAAGYKVKSDLNLGSETVAHKAVKSGAISGYPEYASTALTSFFGLEPEEVPADAQGAYEKANAEFEKEGLTAFPPTPFASANAVGTLKKTAEKYGLKTISDLEGRLRKAVPLRLARVPPADRLPGRARRTATG